MVTKVKSVAKAKTEIEAVTDMEKLSERFNSYLDEMIFDYQCVPPLSENHRKLLAIRLDTYKWVKKNFARIVKEIENGK